MLLDDTDGGVASGVQRIQGDHCATDRNHLQQCPDRRQFAVLIVKVEARDRHAGAVLDQRRGLVAHRAVAIGAANPLAVGRQCLPLLLRSGCRHARRRIALLHRFQRLGIGAITTR